MDGGSDSAPTDGGTDQVVESDSGQDAADADAQLCVPGTTESCYTGQAGTETIGACKPGIRVCAPGGLSFGDCIGEVTPAAEVCATPVDDDCDGEVNEEGADCACVPGSSASCYSGPAATLDIGACKPGTQVCKPDGSGFGPCFGEVIPGSETCATPTDEDCDGQTNEEGTGCVCMPESSESCYSGPTGTDGVGACVAGARTCNALGTAWGQCVGEVLPATEICSTSVDDDCDGAVNEDGADCVCVPGATQSCYSGPAGTLGVGVCASGVQACNATGSGFLLCSGATTPVTEDCATYFDEDCDAKAECMSDVAHLLGLGTPGTSFDFVDLVRYGVSGANSGPDLLFISNSARKWQRINQYGKPLFERSLPTAFVTIGGMSFQQYNNAVALVGNYSYAPDFGDGPLPNGTDNLFVAHFDINGVLGWSKGYPGVPGTQVRISPRNYNPSPGLPEVWLIAGAYKGSPDLGNGSLAPPGFGKQNAFLAAIDFTGPTVWSRALDVGAAPTTMAVAGIVHDYAASYVVGTYSGTLDLGQGPMVSAGGSDLFVARFANDGSTVWSERHGGTGNETVLMASNGPGRIALTGTTSAGFDFVTGTIPPGMYVATYFVTGGSTIKWQKAFPSCAPEHIAMGGEVAVIASCSMSIDAGTGPMPAGRVFMSFDVNSGSTWRARPLPASATYGGITVGGPPYVFGAYQAEIDLDTAKLTNAGDKDLFLARWWSPSLDQ